RYADYAHDIRTSGTHLLGILKDILDFSRIESHNVALREAEVAPAEVVEACLGMIRQRAREGAVEICVVLPSDLPRLYADEGKLKQVGLNLPSNAIKFTPRDGRVTVDAACLPDGGFRFRVADTGIGMRPEDIPVALAPFGQVASAFSRNHDGIGLGLPLVRQ